MGTCQDSESINSQILPLSVHVYRLINMFYVGGGASGGEIGKVHLGKKHSAV